MNECITTLFTCQTKIPLEEPLNGGTIVQGLHHFRNKLIYVRILSVQ